MAATGPGTPARRRRSTADRDLPGHQCPTELVFEAFTEVRHLSRWWGPEGFTTTTRVARVPRRRGLGPRDVLTGPDGTTRSGSPDRDRARRSGSRCCTGEVPLRPERLRVGPLRSSPTVRRPGSRCARCSRPWNCATRRSGEVPRVIEGGQVTLSNLPPTSPRSFGRELRADGREGVLQRVDVAGRFHRCRAARGP